jgi:hypothetical protein
LPPPRFFLANHPPLIPMERRSRPNAPGNGVKNGPRARQKPLRGEEFFPGAKPIEALVRGSASRSPKSQAGAFCRFAPSTVRACTCKERGNTERSETKDRRAKPTPSATVATSSLRRGSWRWRARGGPRRGVFQRPRVGQQRGACRTGSSAQPRSFPCACRRTTSRRSA